jgi:hypothetical protein
VPRFSVWVLPATGGIFDTKPNFDRCKFFNIQRHSTAGVCINIPNDAFGLRLVTVPAALAIWLAAFIATLFIILP